MRSRKHATAPVALVVLLLGSCSSGAAGEPDQVSTPEATSDQTSQAVEPTARASATPAPKPEQVDAISLQPLERAELTGGGLRLSAVRERTYGYTSYDVSFRSTTAGRRTDPLRITGVLNVPQGQGPFPAVVLAHGYIDPAIYERGQGMTRERGYLATRGFVTLHVDYRNHAESAEDLRVDSAVRLGYVTDAIAAAKALRSSTDVRVDPERISLFGRSMGGGVTLKALTVEPGLFHTGVAWASVSSLEAENYRQFMTEPEDAEDRARMQQRHGLPRDDPAFWRGVSSRPRFDQITDPVLLVHGRFDDTCPPRWATQTQRALRAAQVDSTLEWYDDGHAFGPAFNAAMERTLRFLRG